MPLSQVSQDQCNPTLLSSLADVLLEQPYFQTHRNFIPLLVEKLNHLNGFNIRNKHRFDKHRPDLDDNGRSSISYKWWKNTFRKEYTNVISALETSSIIEINRNDARRQKTLDVNDIGRCYDYKLTSYGKTLLSNTNRNEVVNLLVSPTEQKRSYKSSQRKGYYSRHYGDIRDNIKEVVDGIAFPSNLTGLLDKNKNPQSVAAHYNNILSILNHNYGVDAGVLTFSKKNGRVWSPYSQLSSKVADLITIYNKPCQSHYDIQACHTSQWGNFIYSLVIQENILGIGFPNLIGGDGGVFCENIQQNIKNEVDDWNSIYLHQHSRDLRTRVMEMTGIPKRGFLKKAETKSLNGKLDGKYVEMYNKWRAKRFPILDKIWRQMTDVSQTGNRIGMLYESKVMLDEQIWDKAVELGVFVGYKYDAFRFYSSNEDAKHIPELMAFIYQRCNELGITMIFVEKEVYRQESKPKEIKKVETPVAVVIVSNKMMTDEINDLIAPAATEDPDDWWRTPDMMAAREKINVLAENRKPDKTILHSSGRLRVCPV